MAVFEKKKMLRIKQKDRQAGRQAKHQTSVSTIRLSFKKSTINMLLLALNLQVVIPIKFFIWLPKSFPQLNV